MQIPKSPLEKLLDTTIASAPPNVALIMQRERLGNLLNSGDALKLLINAMDRTPEMSADLRHALTEVGATLLSFQLANVGLMDMPYQDDQET